MKMPLIYRTGYWCQKWLLDKWLREGVRAELGPGQNMMNIFFFVGSVVS